MSKKIIDIQGARVNNLKNISLKIPHNQFIVITGLSGSGKSSLAFDTLYAEGQRRYVESLSSYARQFLGRLDKPEVDQIKGVSPAIAIEQKVISTNPRSTVGSVTEIYDYLKVLFARIGKTYSPISGKEVKKHSVTDVTNEVLKIKEGSVVFILAPLNLPQDRTWKKHFEILHQQGFSRVLINENPVRLDKIEKEPAKKDQVSLLLDRVTVSDDEDLRGRIADAVQIAFEEGEGYCEIFNNETKKRDIYSNKFELDGQEFEVPSVNFFNFNTPYGACQRCEGFGSIIGIDEELVIPDDRLSVYEEAVAPWRGEKMKKWANDLIYNADQFNFPIHKPIKDLTEEQYELLWEGNKYFKGINAFFSYLEKKAYKIQFRVMLARYRGKTKCPDCKGTRLRKDASYVKIDGKSLRDLLTLPIEELSDYFKNLKLSDHDRTVAKRLLFELETRLQYLQDVGLGYLTINRKSNTLSGGESQRIHLSTSLGSALVGSMYILDEPSIGLHPRDTERLIKVLKQLKEAGNTVIVVEHDEEIMKAADSIIDIGPGAGLYGGEVVFQGDHKKLAKEKESLTAQYLSGKRQIPIPEKRRKWKDFLLLKGAKEHNLRIDEVNFPLKAMTCVTGVSGSGKSTLVGDILYPALMRELNVGAEKSGKYESLTGDIKALEHVEFIDQNPIGKSSRSNPATYVKAYDDIRTLFSKQQLSKIRGYKPGYFSFNVEGGRCEMCQGEGQITVSMQFMADVHLKCEVCDGKRFKQETLEVEYHGKNIADILSMSIEEALEFFSDHKGTYEQKIVKKIQPLADVGLGYLEMGQPSSTLSGGEAQRVKLASFLIHGQKTKPTYFIFDEPTTGLHFYDIEKLLIAFNELIKIGHSVLVIEHHADVIANADWIIDIGPEGGKHGGKIIFEGVPEDLVKCKGSYTGKAVKSKLLN